MIDFKYYGKTEYKASLDLQTHQVERALLEPAQVVVQGFEFEPVITLGRRAKASEEVLLPPSESPPIVHVDRGGKATLHSPGQLVIYPICNISFHHIGVKEWVQSLLEITQRTLELSPIPNSFSVSTKRAGIYSNQGKVVSIGLRIDRGVSSFGLAINLKNDPSLFASIRPCGVDGQKIHSVGYQPSLEHFYCLWRDQFKEEFDFSEKSYGLVL